MNEWWYEIRNSKDSLKRRIVGFSTEEEARRAAEAYVKKNLPPDQQFKITTGK